MTENNIASHGYVLVEAKTKMCVKQTGLHSSKYLMGWAKDFLIWAIEFVN